MFKHAVIRKSSRIVAFAAVLGATAALLAIGAPADAATVQCGADSLSSVAEHGSWLAARGI